MGQDDSLRDVWEEFDAIVDASCGEPIITNKSTPIRRITPSERIARWFLSGRGIIILLTTLVLLVEFDMLTSVVASCVCLWLTSPLLGNRPTQQPLRLVLVLATNILLSVLLASSFGLIIDTVYGNSTRTLGDRLAYQAVDLQLLIEKLASVVTLLSVAVALVLGLYLSGVLERSQPWLNVRFDLPRWRVLFSSSMLLATLCVVVVIPGWANLQAGNLKRTWTQRIQRVTLPPILDSEDLSFDMPAINGTNKSQRFRLRADVHHMNDADFLAAVKGANSKLTNPSYTPTKFDLKILDYMIGRAELVEGSNSAISEFLILAITIPNRFATKFNPDRGNVLERQTVELLVQAKPEELKEWKAKIEKFRDQNLSRSLVDRDFLRMLASRPKESGYYYYHRSAGQHSLEFLGLPVAPPLLSLLLEFENNMIVLGHRQNRARLSETNGEFEIEDISHEPQSGLFYLNSTTENLYSELKRRYNSRPLRRFEMLMTTILNLKTHRVEKGTYPQEWHIDPIFGLEYSNDGETVELRTTQPILPGAPRGKWVLP